jgi:hypothetical protein
MIEIAMPCCGAATLVEELVDEVGCETCNVALELADTLPEALPAAA